MSVQLHRIRCSACSGFGVHDGWNTHSAIAGALDPRNVAAIQQATKILTVADELTGWSEITGNTADRVQVLIARAIKHQARR